MKQPRCEARVPATVTDLPLVAEYYGKHMGGDRHTLHETIRCAVSDAAAAPTAAHGFLVPLPAREFWTSN